MIHVTKNNTIPASLQGDAVMKELLRLQQMVKNGENPTYKDFDTKIYGAEDVKTQLMSDQHCKCIFCEHLLLGKDGGEVEHFRPKTAYRQDRTEGNTIKPAYHQLAYDWENLSVCCHACNRRKSTFFPLNNPNSRFNLDAEEALFINPYKDNPEDYIEFRCERIFPKQDNQGVENKKGRTTIDYLELNRNDLVELRRRRLHKFLENMERQHMSFEQFLQQEKQDEINEGRTPDSIEFLGMLENQKILF